MGLQCSYFEENLAEIKGMFGLHLQNIFHLVLMDTRNSYYKVILPNVSMWVQDRIDGDFFEGRDLCYPMLGI